MCQNTDILIVDTVGTIDFIDIRDNRNESLCLRIHPNKMDKLVVQLGTACPSLALEAAKMVEQYCAAICVNAGCPKKFSIISGMGAALLETPDLFISVSFFV